MNLIKWYLYGTTLYKFNPKKVELQWIDEPSDIAKNKYLQHMNQANNFIQG